MIDVWKTVKAIAQLAGIKDATFRQWVQRGHVPAIRHHELVELSKTTNTPLDYVQLVNLKKPNAPTSGKQ